MQSVNESRRYRQQKKKQTAYVAYTRSARRAGRMDGMRTSLDVDIRFRRFKLTFIDVANRTAEFGFVNIKESKTWGGT